MKITRLDMYKEGGSWRIAIEVDKGGKNSREYFVLGDLTEEQVMELHRFLGFIEALLIYAGLMYSEVN